MAEEDERRAVADHIRTTIAATGLTQRQFATLVGTSPSRLSTYVTGSVTPSAAMLLRINRMAKRARTLPSRGFTDEPA
ncbi:helix-turn-helix transcriptional regulator [Nocardioides sp. W3-2-3]|nr:helix-turn-helix transcriptional regulator [Nocardioides convexus]